MASKMMLLPTITRKLPLSLRRLPTYGKRYLLVGQVEYELILPEQDGVKNDATPNNNKEPTYGKRYLLVGK